MHVKGKVCVVTGAASGIGEAVARAYAEAGARGVVVADLKSSRDKVPVRVWSMVPARATPIVSQVADPLSRKVIRYDSQPKHRRSRETSWIGSANESRGV